MSNACQDQILADIIHSNKKLQKEIMHNLTASKRERECGQLIESAPKTPRLSDDHLLHQIEIGFNKQSTMLREIIKETVREVVKESEKRLFTHLNKRLDDVELKLANSLKSQLCSFEANINDLREKVSKLETGYRERPETPHLFR